MAVGDIITFTRYNQLQDRINVIMGVGSGTSGYGQTLSSGQKSFGELVTALDVLNLRTDMIKARQHQTGNNETGFSYTFLNSSINVVDNTITISSHGFTNNTRVVLTDESIGATAPGSLPYNATYYVRDVTASTFKLSLTAGGAAIDITSQGTGTHRIFSGFPLYVQNVDKIKEADYINFLDQISLVETNKLLIGSGQGSADTAISSQRTTAWSATITHAVTVDFGSANAARYFFNSGGELRTYATITGYTGSIGDDWNTLLTNMGTIKMSYTDTTATGTGTGSSIGFYDLTTTNQQIFTKVGSGVYAANDYTVYARCDVANNTNGGARYVYLTIYFNDDKGPNPTIDEAPGGTTTSYVQSFRASGSNVSVTAPTITTTSALQ